jgi:hypothetical protein
VNATSFTHICVLKKEERRKEKEKERRKELQPRRAVSGRQEVTTQVEERAPRGWRRLGTTGAADNRTGGMERPPGKEDSFPSLARGNMEELPTASLRASTAGDGTTM